MKKSICESPLSSIQNKNVSDKIAKQIKQINQYWITSLKFEKFVKLFVRFVKCQQKLVVQKSAVGHSPNF